MSKVFNMVGGGGKNISSIIITGLESTDTVTCTKDGKTYPATWDDTDQHWEIVGLPLGTFTVTATNGTKTTTATVLIDISGVYEIEMSFKLWLYKDGDEFEDVTGGWTGKNVEGTNTFTKDSDSLYIAVAGTGVGVTFNTNNMINLTGYTKLYAECISTKGNAFCGLANYIMNDRSGSERYKIVWGETTRKVLSIDLDTTESKYAYIGSITSEYASNNIRLYKMWLE